MAQNENELFEAGTGVPARPRVEPITIQPKSIATGSGVLAVVTPMAFNTNTSLWQIWGEAVSEVNTITAASTTATDGTFTMTVNGQTTGAIDHDAAAATIQAALEALVDIVPGDVACVDSGGGLAADDGVCTITWGGNYIGVVMTISVTLSLTGNDHVFADAINGVAVYGTNLIKGFLWPDPVTLNADDELTAQILLEGKVHYDDIVVPSGETESVMKAELQANARALGLIIQGLVSVR